MENTKDIILLLDIGNTHVHLGVCVDHKLVTTSEVRIGEELDLDGDIILEKALRNHTYDSCKVLVSSVNRKALDVMKNIFFRRGLKAPLVISPLVIDDYAKKNKMDIPNYPFLGSDLFCDIIAAKKDDEGVFVLDAGTCLKVLGMGKDGTFYGGAIAPGSYLMRDSLSSGTDMVKVGEIFTPKNSLMLSTEGAVSSGLSYGLGGMALGIINKARKDFDMDEGKVLVTGGDANVLSYALKALGFTDFTVDPLLTFKGLSLAFKQKISFDR